MDKELLAQYGISYDKGLDNCMGDEELYALLLPMFLEDDSFARAKAAYEARDYETMFRCAHELKGVSGNAALTELQGKVEPLVELLRVGTEEEKESRTGDLFAEVEKAYQRTREGVEKGL